MNRKQKITDGEVKATPGMFQHAYMDLEAQGININHTGVTYIIHRSYLHHKFQHYN